MNLEKLPDTPNLNVGQLAQIFDRTTNSYKFLFFISILRELETTLISEEDSRLAQPLILSTRQVIEEMLAFAWYPHRFFQLTFGTQDQVGQSLDRLKYQVDEKAVTHPQTPRFLRAAIQDQYLVLQAESFSRYVPFRLLAPFFSEELKGVADHARNYKLAEAAEKHFNSNHPPLYRLLQSGEQIEIHPKWLQYLITNLPLVRGWAMLKWAKFLQKRNPNTPSILEKIEPPAKRSPLTQQTEFWNQVVKVEPFRCIYRPDFQIKPGCFQLDHFLPWSFVCHDELWNLIPAEPSANGSKGRSLPTSEHLERFVVNQNRALQVGLEMADSKYLSRRKWSKYLSAYTEGIGIEEGDIGNSQYFREKYTSKISPLISLAIQLGYSIYKN